MPPKTSRKVSFKSKRRTYKPRRIVRQPRLRNNVSMGVGFPKKLTATLKYHEQIYLPSLTGSYSVMNFCLNGLFDPNLSGVGHQPLYFDQYMAIYNHYTVIGAKVKVTLFQSTTSASVPFKSVLYENPDTTLSITDMSTLAEQSKSSSSVLINGTTPRYMTHKWSAKKTFGGSVMGNDELRGDAGANPVEQSVCAIITRPVDYVADTGALYGMVDIEYITVFTELRDMTTS